MSFKDDRRRHGIYLRLWQRHAQAAALYDVITDEASQCVMFTLKVRAVSLSALNL